MDARCAALLEERERLARDLAAERADLLARLFAAERGLGGSGGMSGIPGGTGAGSGAGAGDAAASAEAAAKAEADARAEAARRALGVGTTAVHAGQRMQSKVAQRMAEKEAEAAAEAERKLRDGMAKKAKPINDLFRRCVARPIRPRLAV